MSDKELFTATDEDGDTLTIIQPTRLGQRAGWVTKGELVLTVSGEDGHRSVLLNEDQIIQMVVALGPILRG